MITKREYENEIEEIARNALESERDGYDAYDSAWEQVNWHRWVIYNYNAKQIPALASSDGSEILCCQDFNKTYKEEGLSGLLTVIAFACMYEDVINRLADLRAEAEKEEEKEE